MTYTIKVTQEDIDKGKPNHCSLCPIALALKRVLGKKSLFHSVGPYAIISPSGNILAWLPMKAVNFVHYFDKEIMTHVFPFEFEIEL